MESQESPETEENILSFLAEASDWTDEERLNKLPKTLKVVNDFLQKASPAAEVVQVLRFVFSSFLSHLQVDSDAFSLLHVALPCLKTAFDNFLQECGREARTNIDRIIEILQQCNVVAECFEVALQFVLQAESVALEDINTLPTALLDTVNLSLSHCRDSGDIYGDHIELVQESLSTLFQHALSLSTQFANFLSKICFNSFNENDRQILTQVCEQLCVIASCLSHLSEIRGCIVMWRAYASLIQHHHGELLTRLDISVPLDALVKEIRDGLCLLASIPINNITKNEKDLKVVQRIIKMTCFCLKVIVALCDKFRGYLRGAHSLLVELLMLLFRFSPNNITLQIYPDNIKTDIEQQVMTGIEPLLLHLRDDEEFIKRVLEKEQDETETQAEEWGSYLLLLVALCLPPSTVITLHIDLLITKIFQTVEKSHTSLSLPCMMNDVMYGGRPQSKVTLYEHVLIHTCALVATLEAQHFEALEQVLVKWLLSGQPWPALLAIDVWCFVARFGTSELCRIHCTLLMDVLPHTPPFSQQHLMTASLLSRLIPKLAPHHKQEIMNTGLSFLIRSTLSLVNIEDGNHDAHLLEDNIKTCMNNMNLVLAKTTTEETVLNLLDEMKYVGTLMLVLREMDHADILLMTSFCNVLVQLWTRIPEDYVGFSIVDIMLCHLLKATTPVLSSLSADQLLQVLSNCNKSCTKSSIMVDIAACDLVAALGHSHLSQSLELSSILSHIADLMRGLLKSSNPLVHQFALDAFVAFGQHTLHEEVLPVCLGRCEKELREKVTSYLQQKPCVLPEGQTVLLLLKQQNISSSSKDILQIQNGFKSLKDTISLETLSVHIKDLPQDMLDQEQKPSKRLREDEKFSTEKIPDIKALLDSLHNSHSILKKINHNLCVGERERDTVRSILQDMIYTWDLKL